MDKNIEQLSRDLALAEYSDSTCRTYVSAARQLCESSGKAIVDVTRDELRAHVEGVVRQEKSATQKRMRLSGILFLYRRTLGRPEMVSFVKLPRPYSPLPEVLGVEEVAALLGAIEEPRYQVIAMVMYGAGLRVSEAIALEETDIDAARGVIRVRYGKGNKAREAKLSPTLCNSLRKYWARERPRRPYLFASAKTGKLPKSATVRNALALAAKKAGITKRVGPHVLRHSFATHLLDQGTDVHVLRALLGHASIRTTARYARVTQKRIAETPSPLDLLPQRR